MVDIDPQQVRRILVRQVNWVGDAILTLPALEALDRRMPQAEITLLAKPWVAGLFAGQPGVDRVIAYRSEDLHRGLRGRWRLAQDLREGGFDLAVLFPSSPDAALVPWLAGVPRRVGYPTTGRRFMLTDPIPRRPAGAGRHQAEDYLDLVRALGGEGKPAPRLCVTPEARQTAGQLLADHGVGPEELVVALNPGAVYGSAKRWPADRFAAVGDGLVEAWGARVLLVGSAREQPILDQVAARMRRPAVALGGRTDLVRLVGLLERARLLLTNDTGAMHVAAAVGTPVLAVFGPTDVQGTGPLGERSRVLREPVPCSPCLLRECPIDHRCMTRISVEQVLHAAARLLEGYQAAGSRQQAAGNPLDPRFSGAQPTGQPSGVGRVRGSPAAFLDRDGTIIEDVGYLGDPEGIRFIPGAVEALRALRQAGLRLILVTNQAGVARGLITEADVGKVNARLNTLLAEAGAPLDGIYYCPHHPDHGPPEYRRNCECRKPGPGMIRQAVRDLGLDPAQSVIIGDHTSDASVAQTFPGMRAILVLTGHGADQWKQIQAGTLTRPEQVAADLKAAADWFLAQVESRDAVPSHPA